MTALLPLPFPFPCPSPFPPALHGAAAQPNAPPTAGPAARNPMQAGQLPSPPRGGARALRGRGILARIGFMEPSNSR